MFFTALKDGKDWGAGAPLAADGRLLTYAIRNYYGTEGQADGRFCTGPGKSVIERKKPRTRR